LGWGLPIGLPKNLEGLLIRALFGLKGEETVRAKKGLAPFGALGLLTLGRFFLLKFIGLGKLLWLISFRAAKNLVPGGHFRSVTGLVGDFW